MTPNRNEGAHLMEITIVCEDSEHRFDNAKDASAFVAECKSRIEDLVIEKDGREISFERPIREASHFRFSLGSFYRVKVDVETYEEAVKGIIDDFHLPWLSVTAVFEDEVVAFKVDGEFQGEASGGI